MRVQFCCTFWGCEHKKPVDFLKDAVAGGFSGAEINLASGFFDNPEFRAALARLRANGFAFIAQQVLEPKIETAAEFESRMLERLEFLASFEPDVVNSHTGKDFYSFDDNCRIIEAAENFASRSNIPLVHETHRGRFSFHLPALLPYLDRFPNLRFAADFSHWCNVSESLLEEQQQMLEAVLPNVSHIHARVGSAQSAQVSDPFAPEWEAHLAKFAGWWQQILDIRSAAGEQITTITPEAGPFPYMPQMPYTKQDLSDQWQINLQMKNFLNTTLYVR